MFQLLYELLCGEHPNPAYSEQIYPFVGLFTLIAAIALSFLFYVILGRTRPVWDKTAHWIITMCLLLIVIFVFASYHAQAVTEDAEPFVYRIGLASSLYAALFYIIFSLVFKRFSIYAKRTPF